MRAAFSLLATAALLAVAAGRVPTAAQKKKVSTEFGGFNVSYGNASYQTCDLSFNGVDACRPLGHERARCYGYSTYSAFPGSVADFANVTNTSAAKTGMCLCDVYYGFSVNDATLDSRTGAWNYDCKTLECIEGLNACSGISWNGTWNMVIMFIWIVICMGFFGMCIWLLISLKIKKAPLMNATGSTLIFSTLLWPFMLMWFMFYGMVPLMRGHEWTPIGFQFGLTGFAIFLLCGWLNLALMWVNIAQNSKTMKKSGTNLSSSYRNAVIAISATGSLTMLVVIGILEQYTIGALMAAVVLIFVAVVYVVGSNKLANVMGGAGGAKPSGRLLRIVTTARRVAGLIALGIVGDLVYITCSFMTAPTREFAFMMHFGLFFFMFCLIAAAAEICVFLKDSTQNLRGVKMSKKASVFASGSTTVGNDTSTVSSTQKVKTTVSSTQVVTTVSSTAKE